MSNWYSIRFIDVTNTRIKILWYYQKCWSIKTFPSFRNRCRTEREIQSNPIFVMPKKIMKILGYYLILDYYWSDCEQMKHVVIHICTITKLAKCMQILRVIIKHKYQLELAYNNLPVSPIRLSTIILKCDLNSLAFTLWITLLECLSPFFDF